MTEEVVREMLSYIDPDVDYHQWISLPFSIHSWANDHRGKRVFVDWSRRGSKWDDDAEMYINRVWKDGNPSGDISPATLVYHAKQS